MATVAGLAHEINTPLGVALTAERILDAARNELQVDESEEETLRSSTRLMRDNIERATKLLGHFRESIIEQSFDEVRDIDVAHSVSGIVMGMKPVTDSHRLDVRLQAQAGRHRGTLP